MTSVGKNLIDDAEIGEFTSGWFPGEVDGPRVLGVHARQTWASAQLAQQPIQA